MFLQYNHVLKFCLLLIKKNGQMCFTILKPKEKKMYEISFELIFKIQTNSY